MRRPLPHIATGHGEPAAELVRALREPWRTQVLRPEVARERRVAAATAAPRPARAAAETLTGGVAQMGRPGA